VLVTVFGSTNDDETRPFEGTPVAVDDKSEEQALARCDEDKVDGHDATVGVAIAAAAVAALDEESAAAVNAVVFEAEVEKEEGV